MTGPTQEPRDAGKVALGRRLEDGLRRLADDAVPANRTAPPPPWTTRGPHRVDPRRYGRATPWLVAAAVIVLLGVPTGLAVTFAGDRADVRPPTAPTTAVTSPAPSTTPPTPPTPSTAVSSPSGPGVPPPGSSTGATSSEPPAPGSTGDPAGDGASFGVGRYGPVTIGMSTDAALAALGLDASAVTTNGTSESCPTAIAVPGTGGFGEPLVFEIAGSDGTVIRVYPPASARGNGVGDGSTLGDVQAAYPAGELLQVQGAFWLWVVVDGSGNGVSFTLDADGTATPGADAVVSGVTVGTAAAVRGEEVCY